MQTTNELLDCYPFRLFDHETEPKTGNIIILRPKFTSKLGSRLFSPFFSKKHFRVYLDELGSAVWQNCDGTKTVREIGEVLGEIFGDKIEPIYERLNKYILQLNREKFIELKYPAPENDNQ